MAPSTHRHSLYRFSTDCTNVQEMKKYTVFDKISIKFKSPNRRLPVLAGVRKTKYDSLQPAPVLSRYTTFAPAGELVIGRSSALGIFPIFRTSAPEPKESQKTSLFKKILLLEAKYGMELNLAERVWSTIIPAVHKEDLIFPEVILEQEFGLILAISTTVLEHTHQNTKICVEALAHSRYFSELPESLQKWDRLLDAVDFQKLEKNRRWPLTITALYNDTLENGTTLEVFHLFHMKGKERMHWNDYVTEGSGTMLWPDNTVPFIIKSNFTKFTRIHMALVFKYIQSTSCISLQKFLNFSTASFLHLEDDLNIARIEQ
uniref:Uncharacterized protein n=1 Tax=Romanomermis culicivorax TaxID=13658 RepID=A0A915L9S7_ROMCU